MIIIICLHTVILFKEEDKKADGDASGLTSKRWHKQTICVKKRWRKSNRQQRRYRGCIRRLHKKEQRKTYYYSNEKQYRQYKEQQNNTEMEIGRKNDGYFKRQTDEISHEKTWTWLLKGNFKRETESLLIAAYNNAIRTNYIKAKIDKTQKNSKCWWR